tara:strand:- start:218 stop:364 length:147 start_codon:yes stop_codon:yes gene_type:complete
MNYHEEQALKRRLAQGISLIGVIAGMLTIGPVETLCFLVWWGLVTREK